MALSFLSPRPTSLLDHAFAHFMAPEPLVMRFVDSDHCMTDASADRPRRRHAPAQSRTRTVRSSYSSFTDDHATTVHVDLPGVPKDQVTVEVDGRTLVVTGRRVANDVADSSGDVDVDMGAAGHAAAGTAAEKTSAKRTEAGDYTAAEPATIVADEDDQDHNAVNNNANKTTQQRTPEARNNDNGDQVANGHGDRTKQVSPSADEVVYHTVLRLKPRVDVDAISVERMQDGVLTLRLPHLRPREPRRLSVL